MPSLAIVPREARDCRGLERIEHGRAARHRAGVPVLELAAGGEDERILGVGLSSGAVYLVGNQLRETAGTRKALVEHDIVARHVRPVDRIGDVILACDALPGDVGERRHQVSHLGEHFRDVP